LDLKHIRDHVESVVYDHRDESLRVKAIPPEADVDTDAADVEVPVGKRKSRNALKPAL
jgi:hypothetical protein